MMLYIRREHFDKVADGTKPLEIRVGYSAIQRLKKGARIRFQCGKQHAFARLVDVRVYVNFEEMLRREKAEDIAPGYSGDLLFMLRSIYPEDKERLGVYVLQLSGAPLEVLSGRSKK